MRKQSLNGTWSIKETGSSASVPGKVPGSIVSAYLEQGLIEEPYYRENEKTVLPLFEKDYAFEREFQVSQELYGSPFIDLVCFGIDTLGEIYINGIRAAEVNNMHRTWRIGCKDMLQPGQNTIKVLLFSPLRYIREYKTRDQEEITYVPTGGIKGNQFLRKASSMFGWDWGIQLPDMGIWRNIELQGYSLRIAETEILQEHSEGQAVLKIHITLEGECKEQPDVTVTVTGPDGEEWNKSCQAKDNIAETELTIKNPKLWWPNGYGSQPLYMVRIKARCAGIETDSALYRIGLRRLTVSTRKDEWGNEFCFMANGVKIFAMGADYIPEDAVYSRITCERIQQLIKAAVKANYNCLRVWGGGYYPEDCFYDLCDEYGIIVWQDLMYACNIYDFTEDFEVNVMAETADNVKRLRHHASLGLWCGNNEMETGWVNWERFRCHSEKRKADYIRQFEHVLPRVVAACDRQTFYWPSSPSSGGCFDGPNDENRGDVHYWEVWHGMKPFTDYMKYYFRFCSEFGFQSFPHIETIRSFAEEEDFNIFSAVMESHQKNPTANARILNYISENFLYPKDFESLVYVSQILQGIAVKSGVEHWRRNRGRCMGSLYWQLNDNWPVASWASVDYCGRWKALHYMAARFYAPLLGTVIEKDGNVEIHVQNESMESRSCRVKYFLRNMDLHILGTAERSVEVPALGVVQILQEAVPEAVRGHERDCFLQAVFLWDNGYSSQQVLNFAPYKYLHLKKPRIQARVSEQEKAFSIRLKTDVLALFVRLELEGTAAVFSDNYFDLAGEEMTVHISKEDNPDIQGVGREEVQARLKVVSLFDSSLS